MKIVQVPIADLKPAAYNPRQITDKQQVDLDESIKRFGIVDPFVVNSNPDRKNVVIGGHQRLKSARRLGYKDVPVYYVDLTEEKEKELNLRLNKNTGDWDNDLLVKFERGLLEEIGWKPDELDVIFEVPDLPSIGNTDPDDIPDPPAEPKSKLGDLYQLGRHRLMCGDSTKREDVERLMDGERADMVFTDPPYGVSYANKNTFLNEIDKGNCNQKKIENDHQSEKDIQIFWKKSFEIIRDILADVNSYYITGPQIQGMMMMMMQDAGLPYRHVIIWVKNNHVLGRCDYNYKHEPIFFGWTKTHKFYGKGSFQTSVWEVDKPLKNDLHPTMKPIALMENALLNSSETGQICFDPFGGSGSTLIACEKTVRQCRMIELDPIYCDVIIARWEKYTEKKAAKL